MRRFKAKKHPTKYSIILFLITFIIFLYGGIKTIYYFLSFKITDEVMLDYILGNSDKTISKILNLKNKNFLLNYTFGSLEELETTDDDIDFTTGDYLEDPKKPMVLSPIVYLFNTHQTEEYQLDYLEPYSIKPTVMLTSYMLREKLNDLGIPTIVETKEIKKVLNQNNWRYGKSYLVSRMFLEQAKKENNTLKLYIDLHRDSSSYKATTIECNNKKYARVLFVLGLEHDNYNLNLNNTTKLNNKIESICPKLSRGIMKKQGKGVNGIYNQDFDDNVFLIEVGGQYNNIEEVKNTIELLADVIFDYLKVNYES